MNFRKISSVSGLGENDPPSQFRVTLNENAEIVETEIFESWLKSKKKLSYKEADAIAQDSKASFHHMFKHYQTWAEKLSQQRESMGAFGGLLSKTGVLFDENGNVVVQDKFFHSTDHHPGIYDSREPSRGPMVCRP